AVVAVTPSRMNERLAAQNGVFLFDLGNKETLDLTLMRMIDCALTKPSEEPNGESSDVRLFEGCGVLDAPVCKINIQKKERGLFLNELYRMNIHGASLFPGLDGFARSIRLRMEMNVDEGYGLMGFADRLRM